MTDVKEGHFHVRDGVLRSLACGSTWNRLSVSSDLPAPFPCTPPGRIHMGMFLVDDLICRLLVLFSELNPRLLKNILHVPQVTGQGSPPLPAG